MSDEESHSESESNDLLRAQVDVENISGVFIVFFF